MSLLDRLKTKKTFTHFEKDEAGAVTDVRRYNVTGGTREEPIPDLEPIDELEADTDVRDMIKEAKQQEREQKRTELEAEKSLLKKKQTMKLEDLKEKKEIKELKGDIRKMKYAPLYKTGSGLLKLRTSLKERDSGFAGGGQDKVVLDEGAVGNGNGKEKSDFLSFGRGDKIDWGGKDKTELSLTGGGSGKVALDFRAKSSGKIDFSLGLGQRTPVKRRTKKKTTKKKTNKRKRKTSGTKRKTTKKRKK